MLMLKGSLMTEKPRTPRRHRPKRGTRRIFSGHVLVKQAMMTNIVTLTSTDLIANVLQWMESHAPGSSHQGFPVVDEHGRLAGVVTRRDLLGIDHPNGERIASLIKRPPAVAFEDNTLRQAADHMVREGVGRLAIITRAEPHRVVGILSRSDLLTAHSERLDAADELQPRVDLGQLILDRVKRQ